MAVDSMVHHWVSLTVENKSANQYILGMAVRNCTGVFYADDGITVMYPRGHKCHHWTLQKVQPDGQYCKIQDHDLPYRGDLHRDFRGDFQLEDHRRGGHVTGASLVVHHMSGLRGGADGKVHNGP